MHYDSENQVFLKWISCIVYTCCREVMFDSFYKSFLFRSYKFGVGIACEMDYIYADDFGGSSFIT